MGTRWNPRAVEEVQLVYLVLLCALDMLAVPYVRH